MLILLWGLPGDPVLGALHRHLAARHARVTLLDQRKIAAGTVRLELDSPTEGRLTLDDSGVDLSEVTAVYPRPYDHRRVRPLGDASAPSLSSPDVWIFAERMLAWLETTTALVVNRPSAMAVNGSKPMQLRQIHRAGFQVPPTLITNDRDAVSAFVQEHGEVVFKSVSGVRSKVTRLTSRHTERLADLGWCPTQFQRYIPGREYRVHIVGAVSFTCEILSDADDYRYVGEDEGTVVLRRAEIPPTVARRGAAMAHDMGLHVAGIDLRRTPDDQWYCLEVNPSPGFTYYEQETCLPISDAVAQLLADPPGAETSFVHT